MAGDGGDAPGQEESADGMDARSREEAWETEGGAGPPSPRSPDPEAPPGGGGPDRRDPPHRDSDGGGRRFGPAEGGGGGHIMAVLRERKGYREKIMRALYQAAEGNRLLGVDGAKLRGDLGIPEEDLAAACTYLADEGWVVVDWGRGNTPEMITLTHQGIRRMETEEEGVAPSEGRAAP
ncbi:hypothetical protein GCM10010246_47260 [Streptomyces cuspidosporus]|uniref:Uncharacterized protein n=2 Tax=Streptomyces cuspidosporus TaxID=66882 RepID=A0ABN3GJ73_9ACTN